MPGGRTLPLGQGLAALPGRAILRPMCEMPVLTWAEEVCDSAAPPVEEGVYRAFHKRNAASPGEAMTLGENVRALLRTLEDTYGVVISQSASMPRGTAADEDPLSFCPRQVKTP
jgi:hypothetical protein